jgi:epsilon-lactone hydrolase
VQRWPRHAVFLTLTLIGVSAGCGSEASEPRVDSNGTVQLPSLTVPFSTFASKEAKGQFTAGRAYLADAALDLRKYTSATAADIGALRRKFAEGLQPALQEAQELYPTTSESKTLAGVYTDMITPRDGVAARNRHRVLINLHGGAFLMGARVEGALESIPVASLGKIAVVAVDYRQGPEHRFPAATEDAVAVYKELLKSYEPANIGIYGCSAGGLLTAEVVAWIGREGLPMPGAVGIFCASAAGWAGGDSGTVAMPLSGISTPPEFLAGPHPEVSNMLYFRDANLNDPLVLPIRSTAVLTRFPPTLIITSTRDTALSGAAYTHAQLTKLGVTADLHVWEGLGHGFFTNSPRLPESREVWNVVTHFFDEHLGIE